QYIQTVVLKHQIDRLLVRVGKLHFFPLPQAVAIDEKSKQGAGSIEAFFQLQQLVDFSIIYPFLEALIEIGIMAEGAIGEPYPDVSIHQYTVSPDLLSRAYRCQVPVAKTILIRNQLAIDTHSREKGAVIHNDSG